MPPRPGRHSLLDPKKMAIEDRKENTMDLNNMKMSGSARKKLRVKVRSQIRIKTDDNKDSVPLFTFANQKDMDDNK